MRNVEILPIKRYFSESVFLAGLHASLYTQSYMTAILNHSLVKGERNHLMSCSWKAQSYRASGVGAAIPALPGRPAWPTGSVAAFLHGRVTAWSGSAVDLPAAAVQGGM